MPPPRSCRTARHLGRALLQKVRHAFLEVLASKTFKHLVQRKIKRIAQTLKHCGVNLPLDHAQRSGAHARCQIARIFPDFVHECSLRKHLIDQSHAQRLRGVNRSRGKKQIERVGQAHEARKHPRHAVFRDEPAPGERCAESRRVRRESQIAIERDDKAESHHRTVDRRDHRFR